MENSVQPDYDLMYKTHEYPDPDYAVYVTKYPWRQDDGYLPSALHGLPLSRPEYHGTSWKCGHDRDETLDDDGLGPDRDVAEDPDYQVSEACVT